MNTFKNHNIQTSGDPDIDACERMYSATFRSEPFKLDSVENFSDFIPELIRAYSVHVYANDTGLKPPEPPVINYPVHHNDSDDFDDCDDFDDRYDAIFDSYYCELEVFEEKALNHLKENHPDFSLDGNTDVVDLCNYKGEGEGLAMYCLSKDIPIFISKNDSFYQANSIKIY